ncbi:60S ribosomal protein L27B [Aspergillus fumigatus]
MKVGRVAIITRGRYAGKKGLVRHFSMVDVERKNERDVLDELGKREIGLGRDHLDIEKDVLTRDLFAKSQVVIVQPNDTGSKAHPFPYAIVAGIERYPLKVTRRMGKKMVEKRSRIKPFIKIVNYNHLMPTRYTLELEGLKGAISQETFKEVSTREDAKKTVKKALEDRYTSGKNRWFFTPLRTCNLCLFLPCCERVLC